MKDIKRKFVGILLIISLGLPVTAPVFAEDIGQSSPVDTVGITQESDLGGVSQPQEEIIPTLSAADGTDPEGITDTPSISSPLDLETLKAESLKEEKPIKDDEGMGVSALSSEPPTVPKAPTDAPNSFNQDLVKVTKNAGVLNISYPINIPPGRNKLQPDVNLVYSSQNSQPGSIFGEGWSVSIPSIERFNKAGSEDFYSTSTPSYFLSSLDGELATTTVSGTYMARTENGSYNSYVFSNNTWVMTDKSGTRFTFGTSTASRQDDPNDSSKIYRWMLQEIRDTNNNYISYTYFKDAGQIYPSSSVYTGNGSTDGIFQVDFSLASSTDHATSSQAGFFVRSRYRVSEISAKVNGSWVRKYNLAYKNAVNGSSTLLASITESGRDSGGVVATLPTSTFSYQTQTPGWTTSSTWNPPTIFVDVWDGRDKGTRIIDVNGDGLADILRSSVNLSTSSYSAAWINNGHGWEASSTWNSPLPLIDTYYGDNGVRVSDVNGDSLPDILHLDVSARINNGAGWISSSTWISPTRFIGDYNIESGARIVDVNGDGLQDIIQGSYYGFYTPTYSYAAWINNGHGWEASSTWNPPVPFTDTYDGSDMGARIADLNGDGLQDITKGTHWNGSQHNFETYINNGHGWTRDDSWNPPLAFVDRYNKWDLGVRLADINGDNLPDLFDNSANAYINNGHGWTTASSSWNSPETFIADYVIDRGVRIVDVNGDGLNDIIRASEHQGTSTSYAAHINNNRVRANLLTGIAYPEGGSSSIQYKSATNFTDGSGNSLNKDPYAVYVVSQITNNDGTQDVSSSTYQYSGGTYYYNGPFDKQFGGFNQVTMTDSAGNITKTYYHTGNGTDTTHGQYQDNFWKIGKLYRTEVYSSSTSLYQKTINKWDHFDRGSGAAFVKQAQTVQSIYDGTANHKDIAETYAFSTSTGNQTQKVQFGQVSGSDDGTFSDTGSDKFTTDFTYASGATSSVSGAVSSVLFSDQGGSKVKESKYYYDSLSFGNVSKGNQTKEENWVATSTYINTQKTYNSYGLVTQVTDPRSKQTTISYDSYNLYPATTTEPLSLVTGYTYDYASGKTNQTTDPNGSVFSNTYDGLGRLVRTRQPDLVASSTLTTSTIFVYTDTAGAVSVERTDYLSATSTVDSRTYFDGLRRKIQTRKSGEGGNYVVNDFAYNNIGLLQKESLPYFSSGSSLTAATTTATLYTNYLYDPLQRVVSITNALGTTTNTYNNWKKTITDARGKNKNLYNDAYDNLTQVDEYNNSSTYSTYYLYDGGKNLTTSTDALGNIRRFTYDGLGRRLTAEDLHGPSDTTYGTWNYTYDNTGNITRVIDPKGQTINYTYDDVNRVLTEDYTGQAGTEITYAYDSCTYGKTRLCTASSSGATTSSTYNMLGQLVQETRTIGSSSYVTAHTYDRQGNQLTITNPDNSQVRYSYNAAGLVEKVTEVENGGSSLDIVTNIDYAPTEHISNLVYANGVTVVNTYDPTKLYLLTRKVGTLPSTAKAQDISYVHDAVGNITQIIDTSVSGLGRTVNYAYDDLSRLISASTTNVSGTPSYSQTFVYDALGNITSGPVGTYSYNDGTVSGYANPHAVTGISVSTTTTGATTSTPAFVQAAIDSIDSPVTLPNPVTNGNLIVVGVTTWGQAIPTSTIHDNKGNTYTRVLEAVNTSTSDYAAIFYAKNVSGGSSFSVSSTISGRTLSVHEYSGVATSTPLDLFGSKTGLSATPISPNVTSTTDYELYFGLAWSGGSGDTWTASSGFTLRTQETDNATHERHATIDKVVSVATSTAAKFLTTTSADWIAAIATFRPASGSGTSTATSTVTYTYDNNGNLLSSGSATSTWNYKNQLTQLVNGTGTSTYAYDHTSQRVKLVEGTSTTIFPSKFYNVGSGNSTTTTKHIFVKDVLVGTIENTNGTSTGGGSSTSTILFDATSTSISTGYNAGPVTKSWTHTVTSSNPNRIIVLMADIFQDVAGTGSITSATWKGVPLTFVTSTRTGTKSAELWYISPTSTGSGTLAVTITGATDAIKLGSASFTGIATSSPLDIAKTAGGSSGNPSSSIVTTNASDLIVTTLHRHSTTTATTNRTSLYNDSVVSTLGAGSYQIVSSTGTFSDTYTGSANHNWAIVMAAFKAATSSSGGSSSTASTSFRYILPDHLGGTSVVTDASGTIVEALDYYPYGQTRIDSKTGSYSGEKRKYASTEYDQGSGLNYMQARYQDPVRGQFISQDPVFLTIGDPKQLKQLASIDQQAILSDPQILNSYSYGRGNPITLSDPTGKCPVCFMAVAVVSPYVPQAITYAQSLLTPLGQVGISQAISDAKGGNYGWAAFGMMTAGEGSSAGRYAPTFDGLWTAGTKENPAANAMYHAYEAGREGLGHAREFGISSARDYVKATREFITNAINKGFEAKLESRQGFDILRTYDSGSNTFSVFEVSRSTNGITPRTMFKPDPATHGFQSSMDYFQSQSGAPVSLNNYFQ